jgi:DNA-binding transcriptional LysR family regulator
MNVKALRAFCLIVTRGSLARAADAMHLSQPAVSRLISQLEHELKLKLFSREKRMLVPSAEGRSFYREASRVLAGIEHLPLVATEIGAGRKGRLRVVVMPRFAVAVAAKAFATFALQQPQISLLVEVHRWSDLERWLASHQFDMGFGPFPVASEGLVAERLFSSRMLVAVHAASPLAQRLFLEPGDLEDEPQVALTPDTLIRRQADAIFLQARRRPSIVMEVSSAALACQIVASGVGYALCDAFVAAAIGRQNLATVPLAPKFDLEYGVLRPEGTQLTAPMRALSDLMRSSAEAFLRETAAIASPRGKHDQRRR